jgi:hypothetical protein
MLMENQNFSEQIQQYYKRRATFLEMAATIQVGSGAGFCIA